LDEKNLKFPRVLIVGNNFDFITGTGITLSNLFSGWDINNIAVASEFISNVETLNTSICRKYYLLGKAEVKYIWPLNLFTKIQESKTLNIEKEKVSNNSFIQDSDPSHTYYFKEVYSKYIKSILVYTGINEIKIKESVSENFIKWIKEFNPDVIYTLLGTLNSIRFISDIKKCVNIPIAVHFMDDWPKRKRLFNNYWEKKIYKELSELLKNTSYYFTICESMGEEYNHRYGFQFKAFHNPIILEKWERFSKKDWKIENNLKIIYAGKINDDNKNSINDMCHAVNNLNSENIMVDFEIYIPQDNKKLLKNISELKGVKIFPSVNHNEMPLLLSRADILFLPLDFTNKCVNYTRFSMPSKTPEYMISGVPVLVYCSHDSALNKYAKSKDWAYVISERSVKKIKDGILKLYQDENLRKYYGSGAYNIAKSEHGQKYVREKFRNALSEYNE
jgi:glycosyltransferase involved in cell wall biosynthesis